jgi:flagellar protein FliS
MPRYATALAGDPAATYRTIHLTSRTAAADPHALVMLMYEELLGALRTAAWATEHGNAAMKSERMTRALAILFALEGGLDFDKGGDVARSLARLYHGARQQLADASLAHNPAPIRAVAANLQEIADAWSSVRPG